MKNRSTNNRRFISTLIAVAGVVFLVYGVAYNSIEVLEEVAVTDSDEFATSEENGDSGPAMLLLPEMDVILESTRGGIIHLESGLLQLNKPDDFCPT